MERLRLRMVALEDERLVLSDRIVEINDEEDRIGAAWDAIDVDREDTDGR
jgi:hypothetical protein